MLNSVTDTESADITATVRKCDITEVVIMAATAAMAMAVTVAMVMVTAMVTDTDEVQIMMHNSKKSKVI